MAPRSMIGEVRAGLKVDVATLRRKFPQQDEKSLLNASRVIASTPLKGFGWSEAQNLGVGIQKEYGDRVQELLAVADMDVNRRAPTQLLRLLQVLELCAQDFERPTGLVGQWLKKDKPRQIDVHRSEINQLRDALVVEMKRLEEPMTKVMEVRSKLNILFDNLVAHSIACEWLSARDEIEVMEQNILVDRAQSLLKSAGLVKSQQTQCMGTAQQLDELRDRIQDAVLIALPSWLANLASLPTSLNDTQRFTVRDDLGQIIHRLKS